MISWAFSLSFFFFFFFSFSFLQKIVEAAFRTQLASPLQQMSAGLSNSFEQDAADARLELESEGKKTAAQMSKKHKEAEKNAADVAFGDLLKIQQSLKQVEKRFETAATHHLSSLLKTQYLRHSTLVSGVLNVLPEIETAFRKGTVRLEEVNAHGAKYLERELSVVVSEWDAETPLREAAVTRAVNECLHGTNKHMEGYLNMIEGGKKGVRKFFVASGGTLEQFASWSDYRVEASLDLLLYSAKPSANDGFAFELQSPMGVTLFEAPSEAKRNKWVAVLSENISLKLDAHKQTNKSTQDEAKKKVVMDAIRSLPGNNVCADCDAADPTWISLNYGIVICHQCSGVHRKIGSHLSKVRSLTLDVIDEELVQLMQAIGNVKANSLLESSLDRRKPTNASKREVRDEFITDKYVNRTFGLKSQQDGNALANELFDVLGKGNLTELELLRFILMGANLKFKHAETEFSLLHALLAFHKHSDPVVLSQLLVFNDCALDVPASSKMRPLHVAASLNFLATCRVLLRNGADPMAVNSSDETALDLLPRTEHPQKNAAPDIEAYLFPEVRRRSRAQTSQPALASGPRTPSSSSSSPSPAASLMSPPSASESPSIGRKAGGAPRRLSFFQTKKVGAPSSPTLRKKSAEKTDEDGNVLTKVKKRLSKSDLDGSKDVLVVAKRRESREEV